MLITLTGKEIKDLAEFAGFTVTGDVDCLDAEFDICRCPKGGFINDDGTFEHFRYVASMSEYCEEGYVPLGDEIIR
ncbi:MAG: hypothetical protein JKY67_00850 [Pseudomonadales bacterium]|nr:hypothetical protein [Pseudomonadales bacterium]